MGAVKKFSINGVGNYTAKEVVAKTGVSIASVQRVGTETRIINGFALKITQRLMYFAYKDGKEIAGGYRNAEQIAHALGYCLSGFGYQRRSAKNPIFTVERKWVDV